MPIVRIRALAVLHPFPSCLNAILVAGLYRLAGGDLGHAALLGLGMLGIQFAIGSINDVADADADVVTKPTKPIATGLLSRTAALRIGVGCAAVGLAIYATFGAVLLVLAVLMLVIGVAYDLRLKRAGLGWLCYAAAFPLLPLSTWLAATGELPPRAALLLPVAALAGPALQLANGLVDLERDRRSGIPAPVVAGSAGRERLRSWRPCSLWSTDSPGSASSGDRYRPPPPRSWHWRRRVPPWGCGSLRQRSPATGNVAGRRRRWASCLLAVGWVAAVT